jgi:hypothetical protein
VQAISVIVTNRTDDNSKLPSLSSPAPAQKPAETGKATKRTKMKLKSTAAPAKTLPQDHGAAAEGDADTEEWIDAIPVINFGGEGMGYLQSTPLPTIRALSCI